MSYCDELLDRLEEVAHGALPMHLRQHLEACSVCRDTLVRCQSVGEAASVVGAARVPSELLALLKTMPRFPAGCEEALDLVGEALAGSLPVVARSRFLAHLQICPTCRATWEALATIREIGRTSVAPPRLRAVASLPPRQRLAVHRGQGVFDLRLAVAAAYLFAALTVVVAGNPGVVAERTAANMLGTTGYLRAAVENRIASTSQRLQDRLADVGDWVTDTAKETRQQLRLLVLRKRGNLEGEHDVE